jgi:hypothetical protein
MREYVGGRRHLRVPVRLHDLLRGIFVDQNACSVSMPCSRAMRAMLVGLDAEHAHAALLETGEQRAIVRSDIDDQLTDSSARSDTAS